MVDYPYTQLLLAYNKYLRNQMSNFWSLVSKSLQFRSYQPCLVEHEMPEADI